MRPLGFSTGALAAGNFQHALELIGGIETHAIELSALREEEFVPLIYELPRLDLSRFEHVSIHLPSSFKKLDEEQVVDTLMQLSGCDFTFVIHPDAISQYEIWHRLGRRLCIENMDQRKATGRTVNELCKAFSYLPEAGLCFDIGHAKQIDPTMSHAAAILRTFREKLQYVHMSDVDAGCRHRRLNMVALDNFSLVVKLIPVDCPVILESPVEYFDISNEMEMARSILG